MATSQGWRSRLTGRTLAVPGYSAAWQRASFGTKRSLVQIQLPRRDPRPGVTGARDRNPRTAPGAWHARGGRTPQARGNRVPDGGHSPRAGFDPRGATQGHVAQTVRAVP